MVRDQDERRILRQVSAAAVVRWSWRHRGTIVRGADLVLRLPDRVRLGRFGDMVTEAKVISRLDQAFARNLDVRLEALTDGEITMRDGLDPNDLGIARNLLAPMAGIVDVRTDVAHQPTMEDALAS